MVAVGRAHGAQLQTGQLALSNSQVNHSTDVITSLPYYLTLTLLRVGQKENAELKSKLLSKSATVEVANKAALMEHRNQQLELELERALKVCCFSDDAVQLIFCARWWWGGCAMLLSGAGTC